MIIFINKCETNPCYLLPCISCTTTLQCGLKNLENMAPICYSQVLKIPDGKAFTIDCRRNQCPSPEQDSGAIKLARGT